MTAVVIGAVVLLVATGLGLVMRRARPARIDSPEQAATAVEGAIPGFAVAGAVVGADGAGALAVSHDNRVAVVVPAGRRVVAREIGWTAVRATADGIVVETGDRGIGGVALTGVDVLDIRRLAPASAGPSAAALASRGIATGALIDDPAAAEAPASGSL
ncbi:hypothetical protein [Sphingomonas bacterium]|uniref:hypothetical protein n=1 Tax=Sphingomonas bacterium TaxID=1895847 RepID=UPI001575B740|nr:hypothetical protein [Sphingomonas bacterium]